MAVASILFLAASLSMPHDNPMRSIIHSVETTAISDLAPVLKITPEEMVQRLNTAGVTVESNNETLQELAGKSGIEPRGLIATLVSK